MAIRFYDEALVNKIQKWTKDNKIKVLKPDEVARLFQIKADENNDKPLKLPLVAISRDKSVEILNTGKKGLSYQGMTLESSEAGKMHLNAIPIKLTYQIDIYTKKYDEGDEYLRNFIFNFINYPRMQVVVPYNGANIVHDANLKLQEIVEDNSDVPQRLFVGEFTRWTLVVDIDDAKLWGAPVMEYVEIGDINVEINNEKKEEFVGNAISNESQ